MSATLLYLDTIPGDAIQSLTLAGIRRYAEALGWNAAAVPDSESSPGAIKALLRARAPVAGCVVERSRAFASLAEKTGATCFVFETRAETEEERFGRLVRWVAGLPRRTAVFATNDFVARDVVSAARVVHLAIPHDLTVLGVDNNAGVCETSNPAISSILLDFERAGFAAARMIGMRAA